MHSKFQIVNISITRDMVSHIRGRYYCISIRTYDIQYTYYTTYVRYENNGEEKDITQYLHNIYKFTKYVIYLLSE